MVGFLLWRMSNDWSQASLWLALRFQVQHSYSLVELQWVVAPWRRWSWSVGWWWSYHLNGVLTFKLWGFCVDVTGLIYWYNRERMFDYCLVCGIILSLLYTLVYVGDVHLWTGNPVLDQPISWNDRVLNTAPSAKPYGNTMKVDHVP